MCYSVGEHTVLHIDKHSHQSWHFASSLLCDHPARCAAAYSKVSQDHCHLPPFTMYQHLLQLHLWHKYCCYIASALASYLQGLPAASLSSATLQRPSMCYVPVTTPKTPSMTKVLLQRWAAQLQRQTCLLLSSHVAYIYICIVCCLMLLCNQQHATPQNCFIVSQQLCLHVCVPL